MGEFLGSFGYWGWLWWSIGFFSWPVLMRIPDGLFFLMMLLEEMFD